LIATDTCARAGLGEVLRPVGLLLLAIAAAAAALSVQPVARASLGLSAAVVLLAGWTMLRVHHGLLGLHHAGAGARQAARQAEQHYVDVLRRIVHCVEARDAYNKGHSERVAELSGLLGRRLGLDDAACGRLALAGELHDLGLLAIPDRLLNERSRLGVDGFERVKEHPEVAYEVLRPLESLSGPVLQAIRHHHERMNGTGYPAGLRETDIPRPARILAVADAYDAMTHDRPHRPALSAADAVAELRRCSPAGYDPQCVEALAAVLNVPASAPAGGG